MSYLNQLVKSQNYCFNSSWEAPSQLVRSKSLRQNNANKRTQTCEFQTLAMAPYTSYNALLRLLWQDCNPIFQVSRHVRWSAVPDNRWILKSKALKIQPLSLCEMCSIAFAIDLEEHSNRTKKIKIKKSISICHDKGKPWPHTIELFSSVWQKRTSGLMKSPPACLSLSLSFFWRFRSLTSSSLKRKSFDSLKMAMPSSRALQIIK